MLEWKLKVGHVSWNQAFYLATEWSVTHSIAVIWRTAYLFERMMKIPIQSHVWFGKLRDDFHTSVLPITYKNYPWLHHHHLHCNAFVEEGKTLLLLLQLLGGENGHFQPDTISLFKCSRRAVTTMCCLQNNFLGGWTKIGAIWIRGREEEIMRGKFVLWFFSPWKKGKTLCLPVLRGKICSFVISGCT